MPERAQGGEPGLVVASGARRQRTEQAPVSAPANSGNAIHALLCSSRGKHGRYASERPSATVRTGHSGAVPVTGNTSGSATATDHHSAGNAASDSAASAGRTSRITTPASDAARSRAGTSSFTKKRGWSNGKPRGKSERIASAPAAWPASAVIHTSETAQLVAAPRRLKAARFRAWRRAPACRRASRRCARRCARFEPCARGWLHTQRTERRLRERIRRPGTS
jgi:hypothetical protein